MPNSAGQRAAEELRREIGLTTEPLSDMRGLLRSRGDIVLVERPLMTNLDGAYAYDSELRKGFVYINAKPIWTRRRFTMAHELGHHVLGHRERIDQDVFDLYDSAEVDANAFAAELLMPAAGMHESPRVYGSSEAAELAAHYMVSGKAIIFRLASLRLIDARKKQALLDEYDPRYYARFIDTETLDRQDTARSAFPEEFLSSVIALYKAGEISRDAARDALDLSDNEADDVLPAVAESDDFMDKLHAGVSSRDSDRRRV